MYPFCPVVYCFKRFIFLSYPVYHKKNVFYDDSPAGFCLVSVQDFVYLLSGRVLRIAYPIEQIGLYHFKILI